MAALEPWLGVRWFFRWFFFFSPWNLSWTITVFRAISFLPPTNILPRNILFIYFYMSLVKLDICLIGFIHLHPGWVLHESIIPSVFNDSRPEFYLLLGCITHTEAPIRRKVIKHKRWESVFWSLSPGLTHQILILFSVFELPFLAKRSGKVLLPCD